MPDLVTIPGTNQPCEVLQIPPKIVAVYFLLKAGRVMYVGLTRNLLARAWNHELYKDFDEVRFIRCTPEDLEPIERHWIDHFDPPWKYTTVTKPQQPRRLPPETVFPKRPQTGQLPLQLSRNGP